MDVCGGIHWVGKSIGPCWDLAFSVGCTRDVGPKTTLKFSLPQTGSLSTSSTDKSLLLSNTAWGLSDPASFSEINCYAVFVSAPGVSNGSCVRSDGSVAFSAMLMAGLYPAGATVELDVPSGAKRTLRLVGFKSSTAAACGLSIQALSASQYSSPFEMGNTTVDLVPDVVNNVSLLASLTAAGKFHSCAGEKLGSFGPSILFEPPAVLTLNNGPFYDFGLVAVGGISEVIFTLTNSGGLSASSLSGSGLAAPFQFSRRVVVSGAWVPHQHL